MLTVCVLKLMARLYIYCPQQCPHRGCGFKNTGSVYQKYSGCGLLRLVKADQSGQAFSGGRS